MNPIGFDKARADEVMAARGVDVMVLTSPENVFYTSGLPVRHIEQNPILYVLANQYPTITVIPRGGEDGVITWLLFDPALTWIGDFRGVITRDAAVEALLAKVGEVAGGSSRIGVESSAPFFVTEALRGTGAELLLGDGVMAELRSIKSTEEIRRLREATRIAERTILTVIEHLEEGMSDLEMIRLAKITTLNEGGTGTNHFTMSIGDSDPEAPGTGRRIRPGELTRFDTGAMYAGYVSDVSRHACIGEPPADAARLVAYTTELQQACAENIKAGVTVGEIEDFLAKEFPKTPDDIPVFTMGHSVGLNTEESHFIPSAIWGSRDMVFKSGMVFDLESWGLYTPYGVRLVGMEDQFLVTDRSCERLTTLDRKIFSA